MNILTSPAVEGFLFILKLFAMTVALILALAIIAALLFGLKSACEWAVDATIDYPLHAVGVVIVLLAAFILITGLWTVPLVQQILGAFAAIILLTVVGLIAAVKVIE